MSETVFKPKTAKKSEKLMGLCGRENLIYFSGFPVMPTKIIHIVHSGVSVNVV